jgi:N utilization substance protein B
MGMRRRARELALQMLYQSELAGTDHLHVEEDFEELRKADASVRSFALDLYAGTLEHRTEIDQLLSEQTAHWRLDRLAAVDRNILRMAIFELVYQSETPAAVVIDEAIEVAKKFGAGDSARFVNGVLDGFVRRRREAG